MKITIESQLYIVSEEIKEVAINLINMLTLAKTEEELKVFVRHYHKKELIEKYFVWGFGRNHFWVAQKTSKNKETILGKRFIYISF